MIPRPALQEHIVAIGKETRSTLSKCKGSFFVLLFFSHVNQRSFINSAAKSEALSLRSGRLRSFSEDHRKSCYLVKIYYRCFKTRNEHKCFNISISRRTSYAGGHRVNFEGQGGMRGVYLLVKTAIYYCAMPNNKQPEGVSDLVTRMPLNSNFPADKQNITS